MLKIYVILAVSFYGGSADLQSFLDHKLVPDVMSTSPEQLLNVTFPSGVEAKEGNLVLVSQLLEVPKVGWKADSEGLYTLVFFDPDGLVPSFLHWVVGNIPGDDVTSGQTVMSFTPSAPKPDTGLHRYVFLVYKQPGQITFEHMPEDLEGRRRFFADKFAAKYNLGAPVAGNLYTTQYTD